MMNKVKKISLKLKIKHIWLDWRSTVLGVFAGLLIVIGQLIITPEGITFNGILSGLLVALGGALSDLRTQDSIIIKKKEEENEQCKID